MGNATAEALAKRKRQLTERRTALTEEVSVIDAELSDLDVAIRVLESFSIKLDIHVGASMKGEVVPGSKKSAVREVLFHAYPRSLKSNSIREDAKVRFGFEINPNTLAVSLARLKREGLARNEGRTWYYVPPS